MSTQEKKDLVSDHSTNDDDNRMDDYDSTHYTPKYFHPRYRDLSTRPGLHAPIVAILDTGIDPGALGLRTCPDGSAKVLDVIDCTGADRVICKRFDTFEELDQIEDERITTFLKENEEIELGEDTPVNMFRGIRSLRSFLPDRKYNMFNIHQQRRIDEIYLRCYVIIHQEHTLAIIDYDARVDPIVVSEYRYTQQYGSIPLILKNSIKESKIKESKIKESDENDYPIFNFGFRVETLDHSGDTLDISLVFDAGSHATHVAGIVGGCFDNSEMNGVNPYAKFVSLKIGDSRLDGMETTDALLRALEIMGEQNIRIANYSYGEPAVFKNGRVIAELDRLIDTGLIFITSAGNSGPSLTTIGAPASSSNLVISVGAYTNSAHLKNLYNTFDNGYNQGNYQWSSRGPGLDYSMGVDVLAAGCALTSHPQWYLSDLRMCNGTSMAAPNCAGFVSLVLSHTFENTDYPHPYWVKKYLEQTCEDLGLPSYSQGRGLIGRIDISESVLHEVKNWNYRYDISVTTPMSFTDAALFLSFGNQREDDGVRCLKCHPDKYSGIIKGVDLDDTIDLQRMLDTAHSITTDPCSATLDSDHHYYSVDIRRIRTPETWTCTCKDNSDRSAINWPENRTQVRLEMKYHRDDQIENSHLDFVNEVVVHPGSKSLNIRVRDSNISFSTYIDIYQRITLNGAEKSGEPIEFDMLVGYIPINVLTYRELSRGNTLTIDPKILSPHYYDKRKVIAIEVDHDENSDKESEKDSEKDSDKNSDKKSDKDSDSESGDENEEDDNTLDTYVPRTDLRLNNIYREYLIPKSSHIKLSITPNVDHRVYVKVCQIYPHESYKNRSYVKAFTPDTAIRSIIRPVIPNVLTEICIYSPWDTLSSESLKVKVYALDHMTRISKRIYEPGEDVILEVNRIYDRLETMVTTKSELSIDSVGTRYFPHRATIDKVNKIFGQTQYELRLEYQINPHPKTKYYVNLVNKVYEGFPTQSATLKGFYRNREVFHANYSAKDVDSLVDRVVLTIRDTNSSRLHDLTTLVLNGVRSVKNPIRNSQTLIRGANRIKIPKKVQDIMNSEHIHDGDYLFGRVADSDFLIECRQSLKISDSFSSSNELDSDNSEPDNESEKFPDYDSYVRDHNLLIRTLGILLNSSEPPADEFRTVAYSSWLENHMSNLRDNLNDLTLDTALKTSAKNIDRHLYAKILSVEKIEEILELLRGIEGRSFTELENQIELLRECAKEMTSERFDRCLKIIRKLEDNIEFFRNEYIDTELYPNHKLSNNCTYRDIYLIRKKFLESIDFNPALVDTQNITDEAGNEVDLAELKSNRIPLWRLDMEYRRIDYDIFQLQ